MRKRKAEAATPGEASAPLTPAGTVDIIDESAELVPAFQTRGSVVSQEPPPASTPVPAMYRVKNGGKIMHRGTITQLRPGKEVDERLYDIKQLEEQGIQLERIG